MAIVVGVLTKDALSLWPQEKGGLKPFKPIDLMKVGEGGFIDPGGGPIPRTPDPDLRRVDDALQDIDAIVDLTRAAASRRYSGLPGGSAASFPKALTPADITFEAPGTLRVRIALDFGEFNDDGFGNFPEVWEVGIFQDHPDAGVTLPVGTKLMVGYATFPKETKSPGVQLENIARFVYQ